MRQVQQWLKEDAFVSSYADKECDALVKDGVPISSNGLLFATCIRI